MIVNETAFKYLSKYSSSLLISKLGLVYSDYTIFLKVQQRPTALPLTSQNTAAVFSGNNGEPLLLDSHARP